MVKNVEKSKIFVWIVSILISILLIYVLMISSFEVVIYGDMSYYQTEYEKYGVQENLNMEMEDIMHVTDEMMDFLRGNRDNLEIETVVDGETQTFFNESEIIHMVDVQSLFIAGLYSRNISILIIIVLFVALIMSRKPWKKILPKAFQITTVLFIVVVSVIGYLFATDFYKYFEIFHTIFFEGDTWIFDPQTSLMINMLPEGLFYDMTLKVVKIFLGMLGVVFAGACVMRLKEK